jgi:hypothetical protein
MPTKTRRVLKDISAEFSFSERGGWKLMMDLAKECMRTPYYNEPTNLFSSETRKEMRDKLQRRDRDLISAMFLTGGRISEVLMARADNFRVEDEFIIVKSLPLLKRIERTRELLESRSTPPSEHELLLEVKGIKWFHDREAGLFKKFKITASPVVKERPNFPIPRWEPLTDHLIQRIEGSDDWLFSTAWAIKREETVGVQKWIEEKFDADTRKWISPQRAFQIVTSVSSRVGLTIENEKYEGRIKTKGVWDHWFRSARASELVRDYRFNDAHLNAFFGWMPPRSSGTASQYTRIGEIDLEDQMKENKEKRFDRLFERDLQKLSVST